MTGLVDPKKDPARHVVKVSGWPKLDQLAWQRACRGGDVLEGDGIAFVWTSQTRAGAAKAYGRWLGWLDRQDLLNSWIGATERIERAIVSRYIAALQEAVAPNTVVTYVNFLALALYAMCPSIDQRWLREAGARLKVVAKPVRQKRSRLVASEQLFEYGLELMRDADTQSEISAYRKATNYRDGLIVALMASRPIRRGNFSSIEIGRHLVRTTGGSGGSGYRLHFDATETKNRVPIEMTLPAVLSPFVDRYLAHYRPRLNVNTGHWSGKRMLIDVGERLWVSNYGSAMSAGAIYDRVTKLTKARFGHPINPHLMRDCAATSTAIEDPEHIRITASILGHTTMRTSERHYNHACSLQAMRCHQANVLEWRRHGASGKPMGSTETHPTKE